MAYLIEAYCEGKGIEIGASAHNRFNIDALNVDFTDSLDTFFKKTEIEFRGTALKVDVVANGDELPFDDESQDFVFSSHVLEHFVNPIKALLEWYRVTRNGGVIGMIIPHKERTFDRDRERTKLGHLINDFEDNRRGSGSVAHEHKHVWITEDVIELVLWMKSALGLKWDIAEARDMDDKVGNGFTIIMKKEYNV